ncbi:MAG TPA: hypothetical protein PLL26_02030 [Candidatus Dojkabacteria bacterium]|nr:hypothetical protein [Candidatus Dojkabacteria bacterium]
MSYPLTIKVLLEKMIEDVEDELRGKIIIIVGAEGVTYEWCKYIEKIVREKNKKDRYIYSAFGAADIGIGFGAEQLSCLILKDLLYENIRFRKNLLGREDMPLHIFQYNPIGAYIEEVNGDFVLTMDKQVPLVRYNLKDSIKIFTYDDLKMVMKKTNIDWNSVFRNRQVFRLPFVVVYGRSDDTIILNGANIYLSSFKEVLQHGELSKYHTGKFRVFVVEDEMLFQNYKVQIELKDDVIASDKLKNMFRTRIVNFLLENDKGYKFAYHQPYASDIACIIEFAPFDEKATKHKYK